MNFIPLDSFSIQGETPKDLYFFFHSQKKQKSLYLLINTPREAKSYYYKPTHIKGSKPKNAFSLLVETLAKKFQSTQGKITRLLASKKVYVLAKKTQVFIFCTLSFSEKEISIDSQKMSWKTLEEVKALGEKLIKHYNLLAGVLQEHQTFLTDLSPQKEDCTLKKGDFRLPNRIKRTSSLAAQRLASSPKSSVFSETSLPTHESSKEPSISKTSALSEGFWGMVKETSSSDEEKSV